MNFEQLKNHCPYWKSYTQHHFVKQLANSSLPEASFKHYLKQDYLFLIQFTRAWSLALYKSENLNEMRDALKQINILLDQEIKLHTDYCSHWGISQPLDTIQESPACVAIHAMF